MNRARSQRGIGMAEMLVAVAPGAVILAISMPVMLDAVTAQRGRAVAMEARSVVRLAYIQALKEKVEHRVVFNDESATPPNTILLQSDQGGSWVTVAGKVYTAPSGVRILGSGLTDSMNSLTANSRGRCTAGSVFIATEDGSQFTLEIDSQCHTTL